MWWQICNVQYVCNNTHTYKNICLFVNNAFHGYIIKSTYLFTFSSLFGKLNLLQVVLTLKADLPSIFLEKTGKGRAKSPPCFPTYQGKIEAKILVGEVVLQSVFKMNWLSTLRIMGTRFLSNLILRWKGRDRSRWAVANIETHWCFSRTRSPNSQLLLIKIRLFRLFCNSFGWHDNLDNHSSVFFSRRFFL